jgi:recombination protein RecT
MSNQLTVKTLFSQDNVRKKFEEMMGKKAQGFITSVLQIVASNNLLANADPMSVYNSAAVAATLDLPLNNNLGFAYIIPFNQKQPDGQYKQVAQFQLGYKGFIQLAQRSGQFKTISATPIYEGQLIEQNPLTGFVFDFTKKKSEIIVGYAAYFQLLNGFEKTLYMSSEQLKSHGSKYSQTFKKGFGLWKDDFDAMAIKTVLKLLLAKFAPLSIEMQRAVISDQAVINNAETEDVTYVDNEVVEVDKEAERIQLMISDCLTMEDLKALQKANPTMDEELIKAQEFIIKAKEKKK